MRLTESHFRIHTLMVNATSVSGSDIHLNRNYVTCSYGPKLMTSCGGLSAPFSRLLKAWSIPGPFSTESLIRKPVLVPEYIACTWEATFQFTYVALEGEAAVAAVPVVLGWLLQFTPISVKVELRRNACSGRPSLYEAAYRRRLAPVTRQPAGICGSAKRTSARALSLPDLLSTLRAESPPKFEVGELCSTQLSWSAAAVTLEAEQLAGGGASTVQRWVAGVWSTFPEASFARTRKLCDVTLRDVYCFGEVQEVNVTPSSEHSNVAPCSFDENSNVALVLCVVAGGAPDPIVVSGAVVSGGIVHL